MTISREITQEFGPQWADAERLWLSASPANVQWLARFDERVAIEMRVQRATRKFYRQLQAHLGDPSELATLASDLTSRKRLSIAKFRRRSSDQENSAAMEAELNARLLSADVDEMVRELMVPILLAAELAERSTLAIINGEALAKQSDPTIAVPGVQFTTTAAMHADLREKLVNDVEKAVEATGTNYTRDVAVTVVEAANPAAPRTIAELTRQISGDVTGISRKKAFTLARTETARVYGHVSYETMTVNQIKKRRWLTAANSPIAATHPPDSLCLENAQAGWVRMDQPFPSGDLYPPAHHNCRCDAAANTSDWLPPRATVGLPGLF